MQFYLNFSIVQKQKPRTIISKLLNYATLENAGQDNTEEDDATLAGKRFKHKQRVCSLA
jgi:hypothetical protein